MEAVQIKELLRVLIVDDEYIMRQGLKYMINWEKEGYQVVGEATNGQEALKLVEELKPHIIICDIVMPILDGVDLAEVIHKTYPHIQTIILSGYDNFEYVKNTLQSGVVDYVLKPTLNQAELKKILKHAAQKIPGYTHNQDRGTISYERIIERYLLGHDKELAIDEFAGYFTFPHFRIYGINIKKENSNGQDICSVLYKKIEREYRIFSEYEKITVLLRDELVCIIFCYQQSQSRKLLYDIEAFNKKLIVICSNLLGVCSRSFTDLKVLHTVYSQDILKNVDQAFYYEENKLLILEKEVKNDFSMDYYKFDFFKYNSFLGSKQYKEAIQMLRAYNEIALKMQMDEYGLKNQMKNMIYLYLDYLQISDDEKENCRYNSFYKIEHTIFEKDYRLCVEDILEKVTRLSGYDKTQGDNRMTKMLEYILSNYQEDLKLEDLAEEFSFNYHYLSAYFNQQMKESFSDYLNRLRIEKACGLLNEGNLSIAQISERVGYSEHSYFSRVFKKMTGKTPSMWRRSLNYE